MKMKLFSFLFLFLISTNFTINVEAALTVTESFSSSDPRESGVLIWNSLQGRIQAPLHVNNYDNGGGPVNLDLDPGDGRHGAFSASRYSLFSENGNVSGYRYVSFFAVYNFSIGRRLDYSSYGKSTARHRCFGGYGY